MFSMVTADWPDEHSFENVYKSLYPLLFRVAYRITGEIPPAEDICNEAFIKYYEREKPLPDLEQSKYWLIRVVKNISLNYEKKKAREKKALRKLQMVYPEYSESGEDEILRQETTGFVQQALNKLPYKFRSVIVLKEYSGLNYKEISKILGISEGNVKIRVFRARQSLMKFFKEEGNHVP